MGNMTLTNRAEVCFPFIRELTESSRLRLEKEARILTEKKGKELLSRGDRADGAYLVLTGQLDVYVISADGRETTLYRVRGSETCLFALNTVFSGVAYPAWVRVVVEAAILFIPGNLVRDLHEQEGAFRNWAFGVQSRRIFDLVSAFEEVQTLSLGERLCSYLTRAANSRNEVRETHGEIAAYLGTAREVVSRHLNLLARQGLVTRSRGRITITNPRKLAANPLV
jgi:CRP/FNR family transcriptional regulator